MTFIAKGQDKIIEKNGYIYYLTYVEHTVKVRGINAIPEPCFMGHKGYALTAVKKITKP